MSITIQVTLSDELIAFIIEGIMSNFPEASQGCALRCTGWHYTDIPVKDWDFIFEDDEEGKTYRLGYAELVAAVVLMFSDAWPKGCTAVPHSDNEDVWDDWLCQSDATDFDAFAQLACLGEVIYG